MTGRTLARAEKTQPLNLKLRADQGIQVRVSREDVAPKDGRRFVVDPESRAELVIDFDREKGDRPLVILLVIEKAVALNAAALVALDARNFPHRVVGGRLLVTAEITVSGANVEVANFHGVGGNVFRKRKTGWPPFARPRW